MGKIVDFDRTHTDVILSGGRSPESKDLRTDFSIAVPTVRRSFDSLRSLRMTNLVAGPSVLHRWSSDVCGRGCYFSHKRRTPRRSCAGGLAQCFRKYFTRSIRLGFFQLPQSSLGMSMTYFPQTLMTWVS